MAPRKPSVPNKEQADLANVVMQMEMELMVLVITLVCWVIQFLLIPMRLMGSLATLSTLALLEA